MSVSFIAELSPVYCCLVVLIIVIVIVFVVIVIVFVWDLAEN